MMTGRAVRQVWQGYYDLGLTAYETEDLALAERFFAAAQKEAAGCGLVWEEACAGQALALCQIKRGEHGEAQRILRRVVRLYGLSAPVDTAGLLRATVSLADLYCLEGADEKALPLLKSTRRVIVFLKGENNSELAPIIHRLAQIYNRHNLGGSSAQRGEQYVQQSCSILNSAVGYQAT